MRIFNEIRLSDYLDHNIESIKEEIKSLSRNELLNINESEYIQYLTNKYSVDPLMIDWDSLSITDREDEIYLEGDYPQYRIYGGGNVQRQVITYHLSFTGNREIFRFYSSHKLSWTHDIQLANTEFRFDIVNWHNDAKRLSQEADSIVNKIRQQIQNIELEINKYNQSVENTAANIVSAFKKKHLAQSDLLSKLGVPIKKTDGTPKTFSMPIKKQKIIIKPKTSNEPYSPEWSIDYSIYESILTICNDTGVEMERHPDIYFGKKEETLRDHFLMVLSPHFQSVTGETFNKTGKTDILIRHEKTNVFIAECKFWRGIKSMHTTVDQILGYLTWRDSKAAIIYFIENKNLDQVLEQIDSEMCNHEAFIKSFGKTSESWFNYEFRIENDSTRSVRLAVLCFHFPSTEKK